MTREELLLLVKGKVDITKLTSLSQKTINEELDDVLEDFGDDESANDKIVTKLANRLKRIDGNLHKNVSDEIKKSKEEAERRKKEEEDRKKAEENHHEDDEKYKTLEEKLNKLLEANKERDERAARNATIESVKNGLKEKFEKAGMPLNKFFVGTAMKKLEIPKGEVDIADLVNKVEVLYNSDMKEAGFEPNTKPRSGGGGGGNDKVDEHEFDDVAAIRSRNKPKDDEQ